jgi:hypothetical protein
MYIETTINGGRSGCAAGSSPAPRMLDFETLCVSSRSISDFQACRAFAWQSKTKAVDPLEAGAGSDRCALQTRRVLTHACIHTHVGTCVRAA